MWFELVYIVVCTPRHIINKKPRHVVNKKKHSLGRTDKKWRELDEINDR